MNFKEGLGGTTFFCDGVLGNTVSGLLIIEAPGLWVSVTEGVDFSFQALVVGPTPSTFSLSPSLRMHTDTAHLSTRWGIMACRPYPGGLSKWYLGSAAIA